MPRHKDVWESGGIAPPFLALARDGSQWSASRPSRLTPGEKAPSTHRIGCWMGPRAGLDAVGTIKTTCPCRNRTPAVHPVARRYAD
jgi:hypothetical protein